MNEPAYDLAVVGGGVAGLYCAMHADRDWTVALFEGSHRFGVNWNRLDARVRCRIRSHAFRSYSAVPDGRTA